MIKVLFTKDKEWQKKWDNYLVNNPKGSHLILSDWLKSFQAYGFDYELCLFLNDKEIIGGCGAIIAKFTFLKFYVIPHGLVYNEDYENFFEVHILEIIERAKKIKCCYMQISIPISSNQLIRQKSYEPEQLSFLEKILVKGKLFKYIYSSYGINWVNLESFKNSDECLSQLTPKVRRNIRMPYNKGVVVDFVKDSKLIEEGYKVISENAKQANYSIRDFKEFKSTITDLVEKELAYFITCKVDDIVKAAGLYVRSNGYITSISAGVKREKPDKKLGYMLHWEMIKKSFENNYDGYNISMGGSSGVRDFKSKFGSETIYFEQPHYYIVLNRTYFKIFLFLDKYLMRYKTKISRILSKIK